MPSSNYQSIHSCHKCVVCIWMSVSHVRSLSYRLHKSPPFLSWSRRVNVPPDCSRRSHLGYPCNAFVVGPTHIESSHLFLVRLHFQSKVRERSEEACSRSSSSRIQIGNGSYLWSNIRAIFFLVWVSAMFSCTYDTQILSRWTSFPTVSYWAPLMSGLPIGFSISWIFVGGYSSQVSPYFPKIRNFTAESIQLYYRRLPIVCGICHSRKYRMSQFCWCCISG